MAWRNLTMHSLFALLNLFGLSTGLACTLFIYLWVADEISTDKFHENVRQIYQLMEKRNYPGHSGISDESSGLLSKIVKAQNPDVLYAVTIIPSYWFQKFTLTVGDKNIKAVGQYAGEEYFDIFSYKLIRGKKDAVLRQKNSIVISADLAQKLFGGTNNVLGRAIRFQHDTTFFVSGVFDNVPRNSSEQFEFVLSFEYYADSQGWTKTWNNTGPHNYVMLKKDADIAGFNQRIEGVIGKNSNDTTRKVFAAPFADSYLRNTFVHGARTGGKIEYIRLFSAIAILILVIACINFMNLSTAKASRRLKEVGVKKVIGASRTQLVLQFLGESVVLAFIAMLFALLIVLLLLPEFNAITSRNISLHLGLGPSAVVLGIILITGLLAGSYPALYLSGFKPIAVLKKELNLSAGEVWARKGLVVFQFVITTTLIIGVIVIYKQISLVQSVNLGYNKDNIIRFDAEGKVLSGEEDFVQLLKKIPGVVNASFTTHAMVGRIFGGDMIEWPGKDKRRIYYFEGMHGGYDFIETMNIQVIRGRNFSRDFGNDSAAIIFNEAAIKTIGISDPVGKTIKWFGKNMHIIGIVRDFHFESLHAPIAPLYIALEHGSGWDKIMIKISGDNTMRTIDQIKKKYEEFNPGFPFEFSFLDEAYQKQYELEKKVSILSRYFAGLAIVISCLGLFGLAAFTAQRRQKEISIRKVIGASVSGIFLLLSREFLFLVLIAILIAFPLSWWAIDLWLQSFTNRVGISPLIFLLAGASIIVITLIAISYQVLKAALANPVKSLRAG
jgi:ABC-type antimicrobial peptide transport system permease subunit